ncbi:MAG: hypothetical protein QW039_06185 [Fervidicoccaceae archaeon]
MEEMLLLKEAFERSPVKAIVLADAETLKLPNGTTLSVKKGDEIELPRWYANMLEDKGIVKRKWNEFSLEEISKIEYKSRSMRSPKDLEQLPNSFYWICSEHLAHLEKILKSNPDPNYIQEKRRIMEFLNWIITRRLYVLVNSMLATNADLPSLQAKVTPEELILIEKFQSGLKEWKEVLGL